MSVRISNKILYDINSKMFDETTLIVFFETLYHIEHEILNNTTNRVREDVWRNITSALMDKFNKRIQDG